ncbi:TOBE domain-containing protein [Chachezhania antarctica]|uniref:TOBE domain-containing protein n=1 Tax=Chachezhania antarctica TaxID=2340860 RepID=UPI001F08D3D0|nr:TOBE domain-containing protein [Chachezhania antarctica]
MPGMLVVPGTVSERTFVGERWDYGLRLSSGGLICVRLARQSKILPRAVKSGS